MHLTRWASSCISNSVIECKSKLYRSSVIENVEHNNDIADLRQKHTLQTPQATVHSSDFAVALLAWHSIPNETHAHISVSKEMDHVFDNNVFVNSQRSMMCVLQIAQVSTIMSQAHSATAFHWWRNIKLKKIITSCRISCWYWCPNMIVVYSIRAW